jgi:hypothetical protein
MSGAALNAESCFSRLSIARKQAANARALKESTHETTLRVAVDEMSSRRCGYVLKLRDFLFENVCPLSSPGTLSLRSGPPARALAREDIITLSAVCSN